MDIVFNETSPYHDNHPKRCGTLARKEGRRRRRRKKKKRKRN
jgi:hypothetical protein